MAKVYFKANVKIREYSDSIDWMLHTIKTLARILTNDVPDLVITSANDSVHREGSRHYTDEALDLRTHNFEPSHMNKHAFSTLLASHLNAHPILDNHFTVILEDEGTDNEHIHAQVKKSMEFNAS